MFHEIRSRVADYYADARGRRPFRDWWKALRDIQARNRIRVRLDRMELGHFGDCRSVGVGVFELKVDVGPGYRVYFGLLRNEVILLLCGGDKSSQEKDIRRAQSFWLDYRRRLHGKEA